MSKHQTHDHAPVRSPLTSCGRTMKDCEGATHRATMWACLGHPQKWGPAGSNCIDELLLHGESPPSCRYTLCRNRVRAQIDRQNASTHHPTSLTGSMVMRQVLRPLHLRAHTRKVKTARGSMMASRKHVPSWPVSWNPKADCPLTSGFCSLYSGR